MKSYLLAILFLQSCSSVTLIEPTTKNEVKTSKPVETKNTEVSPTIYKTFTKENTKKVKAYCDKIDSYFAKYSWGKSSCHDYTWHHVRSSYLGNPIIWFVFGDLENKENIKNTTFIECGVHGDEITPIKFCFDLLDDIKSKPELVKDNLIVIAPLVAPDSFMKEKPTRTNARGVDVNRNFPTEDWNKNAVKLWKTRYHANPRRYPGKHALSEQETIFQVNIIKLYNPNKVISVHAPLTLLDYDGPTLSSDSGKAAKELLIGMSKKAGRYKISDYPFFTGSLGNWAGNERSIPTYTLELPNSDWNKTDQYFSMFKAALHYAIQHPMTVETLEDKVTNKENSHTHSKEQ